MVVMLCCVQDILDPANSHLMLVLDLHDPAIDVPTRVAAFLQVIMP